MKVKVVEIPIEFICGALFGAIATLVVLIAIALIQK